MAILTPEMEICAIIGAFIGVMIGTLGPYYKEKKRLGLDDISIFFDKKFLKATVVAGVLSAVAVGGSFPVILENVNPAWSYTSTIVFSATLALILNLGGNIVLGPSLITEAAKKQQLEKQASNILNEQLNALTNTLRTGSLTSNGDHWRVVKSETGEKMVRNDEPIQTEVSKREQAKAEDDEYL